MSKQLVQDTLDEYAATLAPARPDLWPKLREQLKTSPSGATSRATRSVNSLRLAVAPALLLLGLFIAAFLSGSSLGFSPSAEQMAQQPAGFAPFTGPPTTLNSRVYMINSDGSGRTVLTASPQLWYYEPSWAPDGRKVAFAAGAEQGKPQIYSMDADGTRLTQLTNGATYAWSPAWSPDGARIAFSAGEGQHRAIYIINSDGSGLVQLTHNDADDSEPGWAPDGAQIAFVSTRNGDSQLYLIGADGSSQRRLTSGVNNAADPAWSPTGGKIAFSSNGENGEVICVVNSDGSGLWPLTEKGEIDEAPAWSADGQRIAFMASHFTANATEWDINVINADGSGRKNLTNSADTSEAWPQWSPDGKRIIFNAWPYPLAEQPTPTSAAKPSK